MGKTNWVVAVLVLASAGPSQAQMYANFAGQMAMSRQLMQPVDSQRMRAVAAELGSSAGGRAGRSGLPVFSAGALRQPALSRTAYARDPRVSEEVRRAFVKRMGELGGPGVANAYQAAFSRTDPVLAWETMNRENQLRPGDLSDALTAYIAMSWAVANQQDLGPAEIVPLHADVRRMLTTDPAVNRMSDHDRQAMAESFMCGFLPLHDAYVGAVSQGDRALARRLSDAAQTRGRKELGLDLRALRITSAGVRRG